MITGFFGLPGVGKTTFLTMISQKELKRIARGKSKYEYVLTNFYCSGCHRIEYVDIGNYNFENCLILLDEISLFADNRDYKFFGKEKFLFFVLHRHYNCDIIYFTQDWASVDKKIRNLTSDLFHVKKAFSTVNGLIFKPFQSFSVARRIFRTLEINEYTKEIITGYRFPTTFERWFAKTIKLCYRPKWYKYFDSWEKPPKKDNFTYVLWE